MLHTIFRDFKAGLRPWLIFIALAVLGNKKIDAISGDLVYNEVEPSVRS